MPYPKQIVDTAAQNFWFAIRRYRRSADMSQEALAEALGMAQATISRAELGEKAIPPRPVVLRAVEVLGLGPMEREELLVQAGYTYTPELIAGLLEYLEHHDVDEERSRFTRSQMAVVLERCLSAVQDHAEDIGASRDTARDRLTRSS